MKPTEAKKVIAKFEKFKEDYPTETITSILGKAGISSSHYYNARASLKKKRVAFKSPTQADTPTDIKINHSWRGFGDKPNQPQQMMLLMGTPDQIRDFMVNR
jgi:hypothetical protein